MKKDKEPSLLKSYLRQSRKLLLFYLLVLCVTTGVYWLYGLPLDPARYAALLGTLGVVFFFFLDFDRYRRKIGHLRYLRERAAERLEEYDPLFQDIVSGAESGFSDKEAAGGHYGDPLELEYRKIIWKLEERCRFWEEKARREKEAADRYYMRWSHQIKTPIAAMRLLLQEEEPDREALDRELLKTEQYVEMVLQYQRLGSGTQDLLLKEQDLDESIRQAVKRVAPLFIHKKLKLDIRKTGWQVVTDEKWLVFVLEQLLTNAVKYTNAGMVTIGPSGEKEKELEIRDTGIGIRAEDVPRVFEWGYTGFNGRQDKRATGIGLALCRESMEMLGHGISLTSRPGEGTCVRLDFSRNALEFE